VGCAPAKTESVKERRLGPGPGPATAGAATGTDECAPPFEAVVAAATAAGDAQGAATGVEATAPPAEPRRFPKPICFPRGRGERRSDPPPPPGTASDIAEREEDGGGGANKALTISERISSRRAESDEDAVYEVHECQRCTQCPAPRLLSHKYQCRHDSSSRNMANAEGGRMAAAAAAPTAAAGAAEEEAAA
jgi:hypothetical protein